MNDILRDASQPLGTETSNFSLEPLLQDGAAHMCKYQTPVWPYASSRTEPEKVGLG